MLVHLNSNEPTVHVNQVNKNDDENLMTVEVMGDMPKMVAFDQESTIQVEYDFSFAEYY